MGISRAIAALVSASCALLFALLWLLPPATAAPGAKPVTVAALGDSITRGFNTCGWYADCTARSWSTGQMAFVKSHAFRLTDRYGMTTPANLARTGARAEELAAQAAGAVQVGARYVTIEIGANDLCRASEADMTPVEEYRRQIRAGLDVLRTLPDTRVFLASIPDLQRLWSVGRGEWHVRKIWEELRICPSMLARAGSMEALDVERRDRVRARTIAYNAVLAEECAAYGALCRFDGNAVFRTNFTREQLSRADFFHPNVHGQRLLAHVTWQAGFFSAAD